MLYWYPKVKDLPIPQPKTVIVKIPNKILFSYAMKGDTEILKKYMPQINKAIEEVGIPFFMRTDLCSAKHDWKNTCYVTDKKRIMRHIFMLLEYHHLVSLAGEITNYQALVFREFIEMDTGYTAFNDMPVNPERRYFIRNGKVLCHHPYWIKDAIRRPSVKNWEKISDKMNKETEEEVKLLTKYAKMIADRFDGYWSIDFCKAKDGRWFLIDMAVGEESWHPKCKYCPEGQGVPKKIKGRFEND